MNSQDFLIFNLAAAGGFLVWYLASKGAAAKPTALNLKAKDSDPLQAPILPAQEPVPKTKAEKNLNVVFNYNGHSWDAYEVLGVPAGSSLGAVTESYQKALKNCEPESMVFLEAAYKSILNKK